MLRELKRWAIALAGVLYIWMFVTALMTDNFDKNVGYVLAVQDSRGTK